MRVHSAEGIRTHGSSIPDKAQSFLAGIILFTASAGGLFPMPVDPPYAAAKAGLINFALSITPPLAAWGIRVCSLCPQPVDTPMVRRHPSLPPLLPSRRACLCFTRPGRASQSHRAVTKPAVVDPGAFEVGDGFDRLISGPKTLVCAPVSAGDRGRPEGRSRTAGQWERWRSTLQGFGLFRVGWKGAADHLAGDPALSNIAKSHTEPRALDHELHQLFTSISMFQSMEDVVFGPVA